MEICFLSNNGKCILKMLNILRVFEERKCNHFCELHFVLFFILEKMAANSLKVMFLQKRRLEGGRKSWVIGG